MFGAVALSENAICDQGIVPIGIQESSFNFSLSALGGFVQTGSQTVDTNFTTSTLGGIIHSATQSVDASFSQTAGSGLLLITSAETDLNFTKTSAGDLLYENVDAGINPETWTEITHTGDTWTDKNTSDTIQTWIEKVV